MLWLITYLFQAKKTLCIDTISFRFELYCVLWYIFQVLTTKFQNYYIVFMI